MKCEIRAFSIDDAEELAAALNNKKILNNLRDGIPFPYTVNDARDYINATLNADKDKEYVFGIVADDRVIGCTGVFRKDNVHSRTAEVGYYVAESYWGKGIGTCALKKVCDFVFKSTDIVRIFAEPFAYNEASCRILEKAGFSLEGILRKNAVKNGKVLDMKLYALVKE